MPIYISKVKNDPAAKPRVINADNRAQALRFIAEDTLAISTATATEVAHHMSQGAALEDATAPQRQLDLGEEQ